MRCVPFCDARLVTMSCLPVFGQKLVRWPPEGRFLTSSLPDHLPDASFCRAKIKKRMLVQHQGHCRWGNRIPLKAWQGKEQNKNVVLFVKFFSFLKEWLRVSSKRKKSIYFSTLFLLRDYRKTIHLFFVSSWHYLQQWQRQTHTLGKNENSVCIVFFEQPFSTLQKGKITIR